MDKDRLYVEHFPNGLTLALYEMQEMQSVSIGVYARAGSIYEDEDINGISHFLEHVLFKGTKNRDSLQISREIEGIGGVLNGFTSEESTCYYVRVLKKHVRKGMEILFDMVLNPLLKEEDIEKEKNIIIEELNMYLDMPSHYVDDMLSEIMWKGHPLGRRILGSAETINSMNRNKLKGYMENFYTAPNVVVAVAGNITIDELKKEIEPYWNKFLGGEKNKYEPYQNNQNDIRVSVENDDTEQTHIAIGFKIPGKSFNDKYTARLTSVMLGENMSSRLFQNIREKEGLAYEIHSSLNLTKYSGSFEISAGIKNRELEKALKMIFDELKKLKNEYVPDEELNMAKEYVIGTYMLSMEQTRSNMLKLGESLIVLDKVETFDDFKSGYESVDKEKIADFARKYFLPNNLSIAIYGKDIDKNKVLSTVSL